MKLFFLIGVVSFIISGISLGAFTSGKQQRANYHSETKEHRGFRTKLAIYCGLIGCIAFTIGGTIAKFG